MINRETIEQLKKEFAPIKAGMCRSFGKEWADNHIKELLEYFGMYCEETKEIFDLK